MAYSDIAGSIFKKRPVRKPITSEDQKPLVHVGSQIGLPWRQQQHVYAFRRKHEKIMREKGLTGPDWCQRLIEACYAKAALHRANARIHASETGKKKLSTRALMAQEREVLRANKTISKFVNDLADDSWRVFGYGVQQLDVAPQRANGTKAEPRADSPPSDVPAQSQEPAGPNDHLMSAQRGSLFRSSRYPPKTRDSIPTAPAPNVVKESDVSDIQTDTLTAKTTEITAFPEAPGCQSPVVSESSVQAKNDATSFRKKGKVKKPKKPVEKVAEPPAKVKEAAPAVEEKPSWMPPEPVDEFSQMCEHYGRLGFYPYPTGRDEHGRWVFAKLPQSRPVPQTTESDFWPDGSKKCIKFV
jgi:hypothetical protein